MDIVYFAHSYRRPDAEINEFFQDLMVDEGLVPSLDPPSDELNSAKPERHLRSTDGMVVVLPWRDTGVSPYILYEVSLCARTRKPLLVFVEDRLPTEVIPGHILQRRFGRKTLLREVRDHRHTFRTLKSYIGEDPPPTYHPVSAQRSYLLLGQDAFGESRVSVIRQLMAEAGYAPSELDGTDAWLSTSKPYEHVVTRASLAISLVERLSPRDIYLLGAARVSLLPTVLLSDAANYIFDPQVPQEYQPRVVAGLNVDKIVDVVRKEVAIFEQDYLDLADPTKVVRYRAALLHQVRREGRYGSEVRENVINIVAGQIGGIDMSNQSFSFGNVVGPVNINSTLNRVAQTVNAIPTLDAARQQEWAALVEELRAALAEATKQRPADAERVASQTESVAKELSQPKPNKRFLDISVEGLKGAAKAVADIAPTVIIPPGLLARFENRRRVSFRRGGPCTSPGPVARYRCGSRWAARHWSRPRARPSGS